MYDGNACAQRPNDMYTCIIVCIHSFRGIVHIAYIHKYIIYIYRHTYIYIYVYIIYVYVYPALSLALPIYLSLYCSFSLPLPYHIISPRSVFYHAAQYVPSYVGDAILRTQNTHSYTPTDTHAHTHIHIEHTCTGTVPIIHDQFRAKYVCSIGL